MSLATKIELKCTGCGAPRMVSTHTAKYSKTTKCAKCARQDMLYRHNPRRLELGPKETPAAKLRACLRCGVATKNRFNCADCLGRIDLDDAYI